MSKSPESDEVRIKNLRTLFNSLSRIDEDANVAGAAFAAIPVSLACLPDKDATDPAAYQATDNKINAISTFAGTLFALLLTIIYFIFRDKVAKRFPKLYSKINLSVDSKNLNPAFRRFKTAFVFGQSIGVLVGVALTACLGYFGPVIIIRNIIVRIISGIFGIIFGFCGVFIMKDTPELPATASPEEIIQNEQNKKKYQFGRDGWSKYNKSGYVIMSSLGVLIGALVVVCSTLPITWLPFAILIGGAAGSTLGFLAFAAAVPLYHKLKRKLPGFIAKYHLQKTAFLQRNKTRFPKTWKFIHHCKKIFTKHERYQLLPDTIQLKQPAETPPKKESKHINYRTNFIRAGGVIGVILGGLIAGFVAIYAFPVLATPLLIGAAVTIGSAIGVLICSVIFGILGPKIVSYFETENVIQPLNSADYAVRIGDLFGRNFGTMFSSLDKTWSKMFALFGSLIFTTAAVLREWWSSKQLKKAYKKEGKPQIERENIDHILPYTQRVGPFVIFGMAIGGFIGWCVGPVGFVFGMALGAVIGGIVGASIEPILKLCGVIPQKKPSITPSVLAPVPDTKPSTTLIMQKTATSPAKKAGDVPTAVLIDLESGFEDANSKSEVSNVFFASPTLFTKPDKAKILSQYMPTDDPSLSSQEQAPQIAIR